MGRADDFDSINSMFVDTYAQPFSVAPQRQVALMNNVPLVVSPETITYTLGPTSQGQAATQYAALGTPYLDFTTFAQASANIGRLALYGAHAWTNPYNVATFFTGAINPSSNPTGFYSSGGCQFVTDALTLTIAYVLNATNSATLVIDGNILSGADAGGMVSNAVASSGNSPQWITITLPVRKQRVITWLQGQIKAIFVDGGAQVWPPQYPQPKMLCFGDSFGGRIASTGEVVSNQSLRFLMGIAARLLGYAPVDMTQGGSGFLQGSGGTPNYLQQLQAILNDGSSAQNGLNVPDTVTPAACFFFGTGNDTNFSVAQVTAQILLCWQTARAAYPNALLFFTTLYEILVPAYISSPYSAAMIAAIASTNDPLAYCVPVDSVYRPNGTLPMLFGTGSVPAPAGNGNADIYISNVAQGAGDRHPNLLGVEYCGRWLADAIANALVTGAAA